MSGTHSMREYTQPQRDRARQRKYAAAAVVGIALTTVALVSCNSMAAPSSREARFIHMAPYSYDEGEPTFYCQTWEDDSLSVMQANDLVVQYRMQHHGLEDGYTPEHNPFVYVAEEFC